MNERGCYCGDNESKTLDGKVVPEGYCGFCEICKKPGHIRHFPDAVPYTGSWCDSCFKKLARKQKVKVVGFILFIVVIVYLIAK